jgi:hypothetical protein
MKGPRHSLLWLILAAAATLFSRGPCQANESGDQPGVTGVTGVSLRTAPRFFYTLTIPK